LPEVICSTSPFQYLHQIGQLRILPALEMPGAIVGLDDALARRVAEALHVPLTGTLGLLLDAKRAGLLQAVKPYLDQLESPRFCLATATRAAVLNLAGETD